MTARRTLIVVLLTAAAVVGVLVIGSGLWQGQESGIVPFRAPTVHAAPTAEPVDTQTFRRIAEAQTPTVVNIRAESRRRLHESTGLMGDDGFQRFFGLPRRPAPGLDEAPDEEVLEGAGSGFIVDKSGLVLTNNHVVEGATRIAVALFTTSNDDGDNYFDAKVVGRDPLTDSALVQLTEMPKTTLPVAILGDSNAVAPGDWVVAIGNPFNLSHTVTVGVISAKGRPFQAVRGRVQEMLQTDAAINPGNSGGPLLNVRGEVVGINTAILSTGQQAGNVGIGFAVPINVVRDLLPRLRAGKVTRGRIGVQVTAVPREAVNAFGLDERRGALVSVVEKDGPADRAGVKPGDIIVEYDGKPVRTSDDLVRLVVASKPGSTLGLKVIRDKKPVTLHVRVEGFDSSDETTTSTSPGGQPGFGMSLGPITPETAQRFGLPTSATGVLVVDVVPHSPAARSGLQPGDVILEVNRKPVRTIDEVVGALKAVPPGGTAFLLVGRRGDQVFLTLTRDAT
jgi:serine protease Do